MTRGRLGTARVGILTILDEELDAVRRAFGECVHIANSPYFEPAESPGVVIRQAADRSNVPAMEAAARLMEDYRPELVVVTGIAGGVEDRDGVRTGDVVVPQYLHYAEFVKLTQSGGLRRYFAYDQPTVSARETWVDPTRFDGSWAEQHFFCN